MLMMGFLISINTFAKDNGSTAALKGSVKDE
jgi:hypothetical protein